MVIMELHVLYYTILYMYILHAYIFQLFPSTCTMYIIMYTVLPIASSFAINYTIIICTLDKCMLYMCTHSMKNFHARV